MNTQSLTVAQLAALPTVTDGSLKIGVGTTKLNEALNSGQLEVTEVEMGFAIKLPEGNTGITNQQAMAYMLLQIYSNRLETSDFLSFGDNECISVQQVIAKGAKQAIQAVNMTAESRRIAEITKHIEKSSYNVLLPVVEKLLALSFTTKNAEKWEVIQELQQIFYPQAIREIVTNMLEREEQEKLKFQSFEKMGLTIITHNKTGSYELSYPVIEHANVMLALTQYVILSKPTISDDYQSMRITFRDLLPDDTDSLV